MDDDHDRSLLGAAFEQSGAVLAVLDPVDHRLLRLNACGRAVVAGQLDLGERLTVRLGGSRTAGTAPHGAPGTGPVTCWLAASSGAPPVCLSREAWVLTVRHDDGTPRALVVWGPDPAAAARHRSRTRVEELVRVQDAVLPSGLPVPQGVRMAAHYVLASDETRAGGDWFDAIPLDDGRLVVVVGDVVGAGVEASVAMGELRALFEERVRQEHDLVAALTVLDQRARRVPEARTATVVACLLDPVSGDLTYCTAGHPPPVVVGLDGRATYLPATGAGPLCSGAPYHLGRHQLSADDLLVLYSDGLVERPGRTHVQGTVDLLSAVERVVQGPELDRASPEADEPLVERVCRETLQRLTRSTGSADDITVLALQRVPDVAPLRLRLPAVPDAVRTVRHDLGEWLATLSIAALDRTAIQHAVGELVANVVDHAYPMVDVRNPLRVDARLRTDGAVEVAVGDDGHWRRLGDPTSDPGHARTADPDLDGIAEPADGADPADLADLADLADRGGRGLAMARGFLDELHLERHDTGTTVWGTYRVKHPAALLRATPGPGAATGAGLRPVSHIAEDGDVVHVEGTVDREAAEELAGVLNRAARGGARAVEVDLAATELLSSAGVQALFDARAAGPVRLRAPYGSAAQHVLDLVGLPYDPE
jgi:anti-sigma regulatory factor (Ser/Thr protein kinase)